MCTGLNSEVGMLLDHADHHCHHTSLLGTVMWGWDEIEGGVECLVVLICNSIIICTIGNLVMNTDMLLVQLL